MIAFSYFGGKNRLAPNLVAYFPPHYHYVEAYSGSLAVLFNKPFSPIETVNDLHSEITNFFRVLRDNPAQLIEQLQLTPYSRDEFHTSWQIADNDLERARRWFCRINMDIAKAGKSTDKSFIMNKTYKPDAHNYTVKNFYTKVDGLYEISLRLRNVQIDNRPAIEVIERFDSADTFFYLDPPYSHAARTAKNDYLHEMSEQDHRTLSERIHSIKGKVMISGYDTELYESLYSDFTRVAFDSRKPSMSRGKGRVTQEVIWMNYTPNVQLALDFKE